MSESIQLTADVELQAAEGDKPGRIDITAYTGGTMRLPGLGITVVDVEGINTGTGEITLLADHDNAVASIVGRANVRKQSGQLLATGTITDATEAGRMVRALGKECQPLQASIGASVEESRRVRAGERVTVNNRVIESPSEGMTLVSKSTLREITVTPLGADSATRVAVAAKHQQGQNNMTDTIDPVLAERERIKNIEATAKGNWGEHAGRVADLKAKAIDGEIDIQAMQTELLGLLRASRPTAPDNNRAHRGGPEQAEVISASLCLSAGMSEQTAGTMFDAKVLDAAMNRENRSMGLKGVVRAALAQQGEHPSTIGDTQIRASFAAGGAATMSASAGFSTLSVTNILSNTANKMLLAAYQQVPSVWREFCAIGSNRDFKQAANYRLVSDGTFELVPAGGEIKRGSLSDQQYTTEVDTRGKLIGITRKQFINDDLGAFAAGPQMLGRDGAIALEKSAFTLLLANSNSFFDAANSNLQTTNSLSIGGLTAAEQLFLDQTDEAGQPTMVMPKVLLVPTALHVTANQIVNSTEVSEAAVADSATRVQVGKGNPHAGRFSVIYSPWLSNATLTGNSSTAWYLMADPAQGVAPLRVSFLDGQQVPTIETADASFETLGVQMRCVYDYGVDQEDPRGAVKSTA